VAVVELLALVQPVAVVERLVVERHTERVW